MGVVAEHLAGEALGSELLLQAGDLLVERLQWRGIEKSARWVTCRPRCVASLAGRGTQGRGKLAVGAALP